MQPVDFGFVTDARLLRTRRSCSRSASCCLVLIVNRAGWAAHVLGSIFVGLFVFFGGTGLVLLLHVNQIPSNQVAQAFTLVLFSPGSIVAALLAREVALWMGFAIAARGRKVKARNVDARCSTTRRSPPSAPSTSRQTPQLQPSLPPSTAEPVVAEPVPAAETPEPPRRPQRPERTTAEIGRTFI